MVKGPEAGISPQKSSPRLVISPNSVNELILVEVAIPVPLAQTFTYTATELPPIGSRVSVPFGHRRLVGVALGQGKVPPPEQGIKLKPLAAIIDTDPVYTPELITLARWLSRYYLHPLGEVLRAMLPASSTKQVREQYSLSLSAKKLRDQASSDEGLWLKALFGKRDAMSAATLKARIKKVSADRSAAEACMAFDLRTMVAKRWLSKSRGTAIKARLQHEHTTEANSATAHGDDDDKPQPPMPNLTANQEQVLRSIVQEGLHTKDAAEPATFLVHGVTGSGKTEIYLRLIAALLSEDRPLQTIVLVPEISLTPQMTRVFASRFPGKVAVVHSNMSDLDRWAELSRMRSGAALVLIGPRSAIFAPCNNLGLIIVDEEHDNSYKQTTGLTYNGRDVAVLRGRIERVPVILGSATPSMESLLNAQSGRYRLLSLPERVHGRALPSIEIVAPIAKGRIGTRLGPEPSRVANPELASTAVDDHGEDKLAGEELLVAPRVLEALATNIQAGHQAIVLVNRRGYASYLYSIEKKSALECPYCSISLTLHARGRTLRCHYCDHRISVDEATRQRPGETFVAVGYGSQRAEDLLRKRMPTARIERLDSDVLVERSLLPATLARFRAGEIDILVGTQILAKGHDFPNVTLIVVLEVDQALLLPDFRAGERTFQLIVQAAGRAGRAENPGHVLIQTQKSDHPILASALAQDYASFAQRELEFRRRHLYPPFSRMVCVEFSDPDSKVLESVTARVERWLDRLGTLKPELLRAVRILGPAAPPLEKVRSRYRKVLVLASADAEPLKLLASMLLQAFSGLPGDTRLRVDVDPQSLL